jgi:hypothetical protein
MGNWLTTIGLVLDIIGATGLTLALIVSKERAVELSASRWTDGKVNATNLAMPQVRDRLQQSSRAVWGLIALVAGFLFQIAGTWIK